MIAIPNMSRPKFCKCEEYNCFAWDDEKYKCKITEWKKPCPLIEIDDEIWENEKYKLIRMTEEQRVNKKLAEVVRCGECKYMRKYALRSDEPMGIWCHRWSVPRLVTDNDFCSYGERRADGDI